MRARSAKSKADPAVLTAAASDVLHAVNMIPAGIGLDDDIELLADGPTSHSQDVASGGRGTHRPRPRTR
jgi:hypothetical protein